MSVVVAAAALASATLLARAADRPAGWLPDRGTVAPARPLPARTSWPALIGLGGSALVLTAALAGLALPVLLSLGVITWAVARLAGRAGHERRTVRRRHQVVDACEAMLGELRAGQPPSRALDRAAAVWPGLAPAARAAELGGDVAIAFRELAALPGAGVLDRFAGAWHLCGATGSGLASALEQVLASARAQQEVELATRSELASARATARLLAVLPLLVLLMGQGIGARPWNFLLATPVGQLCLLVGVVLAVAGVLWLERIADEAQRW